MDLKELSLVEKSLIPITDDDLARLGIKVAKEGQKASTGQ